MFGLSKAEFEYLASCNTDIKKALIAEDYEELQTEVDWYLTGDECMYYDEDGQNWYTKKGHYVQSLYDKIVDWGYTD